MRNVCFHNSLFLFSSTEKVNEKKKIHPIFPKSLDHLEDRAIVKPARSQEGWGLAAACGSLSVQWLWNIQCCRSRREPAAGLHPCPQQGHPHKALTAQNVPESCSSALPAELYAFALPIQALAGLNLSLCLDPWWYFQSELEMHFLQASSDMFTKTARTDFKHL